MFLTLEDPRAKVQGSRDPLGTQPAWYWFGRRLVGNLTIYEVREAHAALLEVLNGSRADHWQLDLQGLEELDTAGAQLLLAVQRHLQQTDARLEVCNPNGPVLELLELLHLQALYPELLPAHA